MGPKKFFKRVGRNLQQTSGEFTKQAGKAAGSVLGAAAGKALLSGIATYAPEAAVVALKTGGYIRAPRNKTRYAILHGGETVLPANAKVTKAQKSIIASNINKKNMGSFVYN
jgi:hypothetical protein